MHLENRMTVRIGYVPQRSIAMTAKSTSVPTGRKRREDIRAGTTFRQNGTQKSWVKFKPCEISKKTTLFVVLSIEEAAGYYHIGEGKLRMLIDQNPHEDFYVMNGNRALIKREKFERYLDQATAV